MSATVLSMSMSLDGFIAGPNVGPGNGLGDDGHRLHDWLWSEPPGEVGIPPSPQGVNGQVYGELLATGAVVVGRETFELAGDWNGDHHDGVPIFVLSRRAPEREWPLVTYTSDVAEAMTRAKEAAGDRNVLVHGAVTAQLALAAGVLDEFEIHVVPVLLGQGQRLFENLAPEHIELERTRVQVGESGVTHLHYRMA